MANQVTIALDAMGGDYGPTVTIGGAAQALPHLRSKHSNVKFLLCGVQTAIEKELALYPELKGAYDIIHTDSQVLSAEKPSAALRSGRTSSMALAIRAVKEKNADCVISAGNTGALMAFAKLLLRPLPAIHRPAIASLMPTMSTPTLMLDLGANIKCDAENLAQFAVLGAVYARTILKITNPRVGILNIGSEDAKGHDNLRDAAAILSQAKHFPGRYHGFVEGDDLGKGTVDVIVTDGFTGNVALKTAEGMGKMAKQYIQEAFETSWLSKLGYMLCYGAMKKLKNRLDPRVYNGGHFLGLQGLCIKSHGGTDAFGFSNAVLVGAQMVRNDYINTVSREIETLMSEESFVMTEAESR